jgi:hypothetical protein
MEACTLVLFGNKFEDLPVSQRVGDILRVHRATVSEYRGAKHFTANLCYNASWALFSPCPKESSIDLGGLGFLSDEESAVPKPSKEFSPMQFYGKNYSAVEPREQKLLKSLRSWVTEVFSEHQVLDTSRILPLRELEKFHSAEKKGQECDLIVKVLQIFRSSQENMSEVRVVDEGNEVWYTEIYSGKFKWLREG